MDPKWVMSNEEKRIRFKNFFKKKDEQASSVEGPAIPLSGTKRKRRRKNTTESQSDANLNSGSGNFEG